MKRYRVTAMQWDTTPIVLKMEIKDDWTEQAKRNMRHEKEQIRGRLALRFGQLGLDQKVQNLSDIGIFPFSIISFHNQFLEQARNAFVMAFYYPALASACALGERVLNHLMLLLRKDFDGTPEYKEVHKLKTFDDWHLPIRVLWAWGVLLPKAVDAFKRLRTIRNKSLHFHPSTDTEARQQALTALHTFQEIVNAQFSTFGDQPWFIPMSAGVSFIKRDHEHKPFVKRVVLPSCRLVGTDHEMFPTMQGPWDITDHSKDIVGECSDEEFMRLHMVANQRRAGVPATVNTAPSTP